jgi:hypothetical protein
MVDIYRVFHPITRKYTFFSAAHGTFSKIDNILGHKASLSQQTQEHQNNPRYHITSQWNKTRPQQQNKSQKIFKHMETEQHTAEKPMGDQSNKGRNKKVPRIH